MDDEYLSSLNAAVKAWEGIDLSRLQKELDAQGLEIVENQKEGMLSRKRLAEQTKEFRKVPDDQKLELFKSLLKGYQAEIDHVTKRSKVAETAFLNLYKHLAEAPDPAPLMSSVANHAKMASEVVSLQVENQRLKEDLQEMEKELVGLRGSDGSMQALKARLSKYEQMLDDMVNEKVLAKEVEMKQLMDEKIRIYKESEYSLQRQLNQLKDELVGVKSTNDLHQAKLVDHSRQFDEEIAVKLGELEIVSGDLERASAKISQLERENALLKKDLASYRGEGPSVARGEWQDPVALLRKIKAQDVEINKLLQEVEKSRSARNEKEASLLRRINELERESAVRRLETEELREKLLRFDDYDRIKHELEVMKHVEFLSPIAGDSGETPKSPETESAVVGGDSYVDYSLEKLLMDKNKRLQGDVTSLKLSISGLEETLAQTKEQLSASQSKSEAQSRLITKLEEDMYKLNSLVALPTRGISAPDAKSQTSDPLLMISTGAEVPQSSLDAALKGSMSGATPPAPRPGSRQRDRYRHRNSELEDQNKMLSTTVSELKASIESLKQDNVKLFEKLKYAESFTGPQKSPTPFTLDPTPSFTLNTTNTAARRQPSTPLPLYALPGPSAHDDVTERYSQAYEARLDPFRRFHRQEELRRVSGMNPPERAVFMLTQFLARSRVGRGMVVGYAAVLHIVVFGVLWVMSGWECRHDHELPLPRPKLLPVQ
ncbi:CASP C terminal-domain-containing protein [Zopfochytrium polystomum]|nr:CASP C terminal-domain-containing protein [Zopfochytrium polystomum]